ncbi:MAG: BrxA/BrxB family bacilliredoxin [Planctomycetota bacterium]|nr:BrxA/BrxB family bacilliredoxin [Planctomycetota bacterium]
MPYPEELVAPMRAELSSIGVEELRTASAVDKFMGQKAGTAMVVVNSVCGCAAGGARPGIRLALKAPNRPDRVATVFAGQDLEAVAKARGYFSDVPPSSPSIALFKDGELVHFVPRHMIEGRSPDMIAQELVQAFQEHCVKA